MTFYSHVCPHSGLALFVMFSFFGRPGCALLESLTPLSALRWLFHALLRFTVAMLHILDSFRSCVFCDVRFDRPGGAVGVVDAAEYHAVASSCLASF